MSQQTNTFSLTNNNGSLNYDINGNFTCISNDFNVNINDTYYCDIKSGDMITQNHTGNITFSNDLGIIKLTSNASKSNAITLVTTNQQSGIKYFNRK